MRRSAILPLAGGNTHRLIVYYPICTAGFGGRHQILVYLLPASLHALPRTAPISAEIRSCASGLLSAAQTKDGLIVQSCDLCSFTIDASPVVTGVRGDYCHSAEVFKGIMHGVFFLYWPSFVPSPVSNLPPNKAGNLPFPRFVVGVHHHQNGQPSSPLRDAPPPCQLAGKGAVSDQIKTTSVPSPPNPFR